MIRTLRGTVDANQGVRRLIVDDGNPTHAYRVVEFHVISNDPSTSAGDCYATLSLSEDGARTWTLSDNRQIGWAGHVLNGTSAPVNTMSVIDPDHIVVRDLWVFGEGTTSAPGYQYLVVLEKLDISEDRAVLALIKERSQDDI